MYATHHQTKQQGLLMLVVVIIIALLSSAYVLRHYNVAAQQRAQDKKTMLALAVAKQALLAYAAEPISALPNKALLTCGTNCIRPGDLPCPDTSNNGEAGTKCNSQSTRLGRLPWKTLGVDDLRDGAGERLWYAVSNQYKNNHRVLSLNSDSLATISLRNAEGVLINDAGADSGLVALIIAPGRVLTRADGLRQYRSPANINLAQHYLDIALNEDNADFVDGTDNGFVIANKHNQSNINDVILPISRDEINVAMESRVLLEVRQAMQYFYKVNAYYPLPASASDTSCFGTVTLAAGACVESSNQAMGRVAVTSSTNGTDLWASLDQNSILRGEQNNNWFQQNGWRELLFYAPASTCTQTANNCSAVGGDLILDHAQSPIDSPSANNKQVVLLVTGKTLQGQTRVSNSDKTLLINYLEDTENLDMDKHYMRQIVEPSNNDRLVAIP
ncbi:MAG: type II secretion system protein [Methylophilus sp.]